MLGLLGGALGGIVGLVIPYVPMYLNGGPGDGSGAHGALYVGILLGAFGALVGLGLGIYVAVLWARQLKRDEER